MKDFGYLEEEFQKNGFKIDSNGYIRFLSMRKLPLKESGKSYYIAFVYVAYAKQCTWSITEVETTSKFTAKFSEGKVSSGTIDIEKLIKFVYQEFIDTQVGANIVELVKFLYEQ